MDNEAKGYILRSKCLSYEQGEKSTKYFFNLEKNKSMKGTIRSLVGDDNIEITESSDILSNIKNFYVKLFTKTSTENKDSCKQFLSKIQTPVLNENDRNICEIEITTDSLYISLCSMGENKTPGNDGLSKEFYMKFWQKLKEPLYRSLMQGKRKGELSTSQRQAVIKLLGKKGRDKRLLRNWRPISQLNVDMKLLTKTLATKMKEVLPKLISPDQTAYVANRFIGESARLISDILELTKQLEIDGYLVTIDIEKAFDSMDHDFLLEVLEKFGFGKSFIHWIEVI